ncbi:MAG: hypothetical protein WCK67_10940 [bacterium]
MQINSFNKNLPSYFYKNNLMSKPKIAFASDNLSSTSEQDKNIQNNNSYTNWDLISLLSQNYCMNNPNQSQNVQENGNVENIENNPAVNENVEIKNIKKNAKLVNISPQEIDSFFESSKLHNLESFKIRYFGAYHDDSDYSKNNFVAVYSEKNPKNPDDFFKKENFRIITGNGSSGVVYNPILKEPYIDKNENYDFETENYTLSLSKPTKWEQPISPQIYKIEKKKDLLLLNTNNPVQKCSKFLTEVSKGIIDKDKANLVMTEMTKQGFDPLYCVYPSRYSSLDYKSGDNVLILCSNKNEEVKAGYLNIQNGNLKVINSEDNYMSPITDVALLYSPELENYKYSINVDGVDFYVPKEIGKQPYKKAMELTTLKDF